MITAEKVAEILRKHHVEKWRVGTIAAQLHLHHSTVRRVLTRAGIPPAEQSQKPSLVDPFLPFIIEQLEKYPRLPASRLFVMVRERGYRGGPDHFRSIVGRHRPRPPAEAYLQLRTLPGEQAQVDWGHFGHIQVGRATRPLMAFVMVLSSSRQVFLRFYLSAAMPSFLRGHVDAFEFFGGIPRVLLYDNLKSAVLERVGEAIRFNPVFLELSAHYRFEPKPVAVARGNQKGRVERAIRYVRTSFFPAREWEDVDDLNVQALQWCTGLAADRPWPEDHKLRVRDVFAAEQKLLLPLPDNPFPTLERVEVSIPKTPYAQFDLNRYSVPAAHVQRSLTVVADLKEVRVLCGNTVVATHVRTYDRDQIVEDRAHIQEVEDAKRRAREHRGMDALHQAVPSTAPLLRAVAARGGNLGSTTAGLLHLMRSHGAQALEAAVASALQSGAAHLSAVRHILTQRAQHSGAPPPLPLSLPDDPRVRDATVRPHDLSTYDQLKDKPK